MTTETTRPYRVIGTRPLRPDGIDKVTGRAQFGADIRLPGMLYGRVKRSPHAHARILRIDTSRAEALPGVHAVITAADLPGAEDRVADVGESAVNMRELSGNVLAQDKALYRGHAVAAVAAVSPHVAAEALDLIHVEYEPLPAVLDARDAMRPDAPLLDERRVTRSMAGESGGPSNVAAHYQFVTGDAEQGFAEADVVVEREFVTKMVHQGYIEPHAATATWSSDGQITIWTCTQGAFTVRDQCVAILDVPPSKIRVIPTEIGGGFGGKTVVYLEPVAALLAKRAGRPVKVQMDRTEVFEGTGPTSGIHARVKMGATKDGRITAADLELVYEAGAYPGSPVMAGCMTALAPYDVANSKIDGYDVVVNKPKVAAYRAPGAPAAAFAVEQVVDELAERLAIDPLRFRLKNSSREGTRGPGGRPFPRIGHEECLEAALASAHYNTPLEGPSRGRGVASGFWFNGGMRSSVTVIVNGDGTVSLVEGSTDIGGSRASLAMQLAETLGIGVEAVKPTVADTDAVGYNDVTGGSRVTFATGIAVHEAGMEVRRQLVARAAQHWGVAAEDIAYEDGRLTCASDPAKSATFAEMAVEVLRTGAPLVATGSVVGRGVGGAFSTQIADVEVDPETGKVTILRYTVVQDAGTAVHPAYVEGQMQGGVVQGIGWALNEEYAYDDAGRMANASFLDYRMPTALDVPMIETIIVEVPNPRHPFGVRGVGEVPIVPPLAAIANAIYRATGVRQTQLPMSPRRILETTAGLS
ncbi:MAG TPA: xanthine dehydrogenase family protein molybdopterin-binding subunit [Dehalococcoidia bacterium]|nr:xanthine dehydrogenase family protein molybdopterin-binding subunit [Dehalococcoidia bacterium]